MQHDVNNEASTVKPKADFSIVKTPAFLLCCAGLAIANLGMFSPFFYVSSYAASLHMSTSFTFYLVSIVNGASFFGRILPGILADRYGCFNLLFCAALTSGIVAFCWTGATSVAGVTVWALAYGFASGVSSVLITKSEVVTDITIGYHESADRLHLSPCNTRDNGYGYGNGHGLYRSDVCESAS